MVPTGGDHSGVNGPECGQGADIAQNADPIAGLNLCGVIDQHIG